MKTAAVVLLLAISPLFGAAKDAIPEAAQRVDAGYRLFKTENIYTFLNLNTRTGQIWQVQWSQGEDGKRWIQPINTSVLGRSNQRYPGRFTLYPTINMYTFLLLDQEDGILWQVSWGDDEHRGLLVFQQVAPTP